MKGKPQARSLQRLSEGLLSPGDTLSQRIVRGGFWVIGLRLTQQFFNFVRLIVLARILAPHDFGLMGIALVTMASLETFSQTGFQAALIQKKENIDSYLNSAWTVLVLRGFVLFAILFFIAPYVATFFDTSKALHIIRVIGFAILFQAFTNIGVIYFRKELEFNKQFIYQFSGTLADFVVAVSAALILRSVWALVFGVLAGNAVRCILSYFIHHYRPHFSSDLGKLKELFGFGRWILGSSILVFFVTQGDDIFVGKLLGASALGFYQMAYRISNLPATEITHVISQITFPAYSKLQDNISKLRDAYLKVLQFTAFLSFPMAGLIFLLAHDFTRIFLGAKWMQVVPAMQVLALYGLLRAMGATTGPLFQGMGKPRIATALQFAQLALLAIFIYPLTIRLDILGTSLATTLALLIANVGAFYMVIKVTNCGLNRFCKMLVFPLIDVVVVIFATMLIIGYVKTIEIEQFILLISFTVLSYCGLAYLLDRCFNYGIGDVMREYIGLISRERYSYDKN